MKYEDEFINKFKSYFTECDFKERDINRVKALLSEYKESIRIELEATIRNTPIVIYRDIVKIKTKFVQKKDVRLHYRPTEDELLMNKNVANKILYDSCNFLEVHPSKVFERRRKPNQVLIRYMIFKILKLETSMSLGEIGDFMGGYDHTTVIHGIRKIEDLCETESFINKQFNELHQHIVGKKDAA